MGESEKGGLGGVVRQELLATRVGEREVRPVGKAQDFAQAPVRVEEGEANEEIVPGMLDDEILNGGGEEEGKEVPGGLSRTAKSSSQTPGSSLQGRVAWSHCSRARGSPSRPPHAESRP